MMIPEKTLPVHELKYYHSDNLGFVFIGASKSSDDAIQRLAQFLVDIGVSNELPEFYQRVKSNAVAFVYGGNSGFQSGNFYRAASRTNLMGIFKIETLGIYLDGLQA
jgi:hypothetical protein